VVPYGSGLAAITVGGRTLELPLQPSRLYPSPPALLVLAYGDPRAGAALDIQAPPEAGTAVTSDAMILTLALPAGGELRTLTSMQGECSITLERVGPGGVRGRFTCRGLHPDTGGPALAAAGTFSAGPSGSVPSPAPSPTPTTSASPAEPGPSGSAHVRVSGPREGRLSLPLRPPAIFVRGGGMQVFYGESGGPLLGLGGSAFVGSRRTSTLLTLALSGPGLDLASSSGECNVSIRRPSPSEVRGGFSCPRLDTPRGVVTLSGTFGVSGLRPPG
jgi:hypothetical protein